MLAIPLMVVIIAVSLLLLLFEISILVPPNIENPAPFQLLNLLCILGHEEICLLGVGSRYQLKAAAHPHQESQSSLAWTMKKSLRAVSVGIGVLVASCGAAPRISTAKAP